jgi:hypothetical protein
LRRRLKYDAARNTPLAVTPVVTDEEKVPLSYFRQRRPVGYRLV